MNQFRAFSRKKCPELIYCYSVLILFTGFSLAFFQHSTGHCQYRNETDQQEGDNEYPSTDRSFVGKSFQPVMSNPPAEGSCQCEADDQHDDITLSKHIEDFAGGTSHDLPDTDFLASVFTFEYGKSEHTSQADGNGNQGE